MTELLFDDSTQNLFHSEFEFELHSEYEKTYRATSLDQLIAQIDFLEETVAGR